MARQTRQPKQQSRQPRTPTGVAGRTLMVLFACAAIAMLGLLAGGEHRVATARRGADPMNNYYPPDMPRYPNTVEFPAGKNTRVGGSSTRMSYFITEDEPAKVAGHYGRFWRSRKLWVRDDVTHVGGVISAVDEKLGQVYQLLIVVRQGQTHVFPSVTRSPTAATDVNKTTTPVPLVPESRVLWSMTTSEGETLARMVLSTNEAGLDASLQHYRSVLAAAGYHPERAKGERVAKPTDNKDPAPGAHRILLYQNDAGDEITINLTVMGGDRVRVHIVAVGEKE